MVIKTPCDIGDTVVINGKKYTCGGFIIGSSGANVNLFDEKHKLFQPNFEQVEEALTGKARARFIKGLAEGFGTRRFERFVPKTPGEFACMLTYTSRCDYCIKENCEHPAPDGSDCYENIKAFLKRRRNEKDLLFF